MAERRLAALTKAVDTENDILRIPYFDQHPQGAFVSFWFSCFRAFSSLLVRFSFFSGLLFELTRCHFFKGDSFSVLQSLCTLGGQTSAFEMLSPHLTRYLSMRANKLVEDLAPALAGQPAELNNLLTLILNSLKQSSLSDQLLLTIVVALSKFQSC